MMTDHLREVMEQLADQPEAVQEQYAPEALSNGTR